MTQKTALITGAARGIGLATATRFLAEGWRVVMLDRETETLAAAHLAIGSNDAIKIDCDVSDADQVAQAASDAEDAFGRIDALVNNAGVADFSPADKTSFDSWREIMSTNLDGVFLMSQAIIPMLARQGGAIVNIGSISGLRASTLRSAYGTSKAAVAHLTKQQAVELAEQGIRVNAVAPGPVETAMAKKVHTPAIRKDYRDHIPLGRYGLESELAAAIWFLCSDDASFINGQVLAVDGGFEAAGVGIPTLRGED
jgi:NAD(P)-dependent dehydrogenase (short-subunit alcohol dehydrogenase family)